MKFILTDPALPEKAGDYLFGEYNRCREAMLGMKTVSDEGEAGETNGIRFSIGVNDFPEDDISLESVAFLTSTYCALRSVLSVPPPAVTDKTKVAAILLSRHTLSIAETYLLKIALFLATDRRYNPENPVRINATQVLSAESADLAPIVTTLAEVLVLVDAALIPHVEQTLLANELRILQLSAAVFFDTLDSAFDLKSVRKCRIAFNRLMQSLGTHASIAAAANYARRHKTMYREIVELRAHGEAPRLPAANPPVVELEQKIAALQDALAANTRVVANMDRRQRDLLATVKKSIGGFVRLFRPSKPQPTREQAAAALSEKKDRYACLQRITEPHRSQLKAVIDYTVDHPIVHKGRTRDDFTLSNAARVVWNRHATSWSKIPGSFETFDQLKSACYNLQEKDDDPFRYQT